VTSKPLFNKGSSERFKKTVLTFHEVKTRLADEQTTVVVPLSTLIDLSSPSAAEKSVYEVEVNLSFEQKPIGSYRVYVNLPSLKATADTDTYYAGAIVFFEPIPKARTIKTLLFDITNNLITQVKKREQPDKIECLTLTFIQSEGLSGQDIIIESVVINKYE